VRLTDRARDLPLIDHDRGSSRGGNRRRRRRFVNDKSRFSLSIRDKPRDERSEGEDERETREMIA